jgi:hypothetical protein
MAGNAYLSTRIAAAFVAAFFACAAQAAMLQLPLARAEIGLARLPEGEEAGSGRPARLVGHSAATGIVSSPLVGDTVMTKDGYRLGDVVEVQQLKGGVRRVIIALEGRLREHGDVAFFYTGRQVPNPALPSLRPVPRRNQKEAAPATRRGASDARTTPREGSTRAGASKAPASSPEAGNDPDKGDDPDKRDDADKAEGRDGSGDERGAERAREEKPEKSRSGKGRAGQRSSGKGKAKDDDRANSGRGNGSEDVDGDGADDDPGKSGKGNRGGD